MILLCVCRHKDVGDEVIGHFEFIAVPRVGEDLYLHGLGGGAPFGKIHLKIDRIEHVITQYRKDAPMPSVINIICTELSNVTNPV